MIDKFTNTTDSSPDIFVVLSWKYFYCEMIGHCTKLIYVPEQPLVIYKSTKCIMAIDNK